jgi:quercetin dioxygenase-like cupin family protein
MAITFGCHWEAWMKQTSAAAILVLIAGGLSGTAAAPPGLTRTDLQRHDLSIPGREVVQTRIDFPPGAVAGRHKHPGEEIIYVLRGTLEYHVDGAPAVTLTAGGVLFIPSGVVHSARNVGSGVASELGTYVVEKGKPLVVPVP